jgi:hypothetical protein
MLSTLFGPKREKVARDCRKLCNEGPYMIRMIRCWSVRYMGHVAHMGVKRDTCGELIHRAPQIILWNPDFIAKQNCKPAAISLM